MTDKVKCIIEVFRRDYWLNGEYLSIEDYLEDTHITSDFSLAECHEIYVALINEFSK